MYFVMGYAALQIYLGFDSSAGVIAHFITWENDIWLYVNVYWRKKNNNGQFITDLKNSLTGGNIYPVYIY